MLPSLAAARPFAFTCVCACAFALVLTADSAIGQDSPTPVAAGSSAARIRGLESEIARDRARLEDLVSEPVEEGEGVPIAKRRELAEIAERLPALQAELARVREAAVPGPAPR